MSAEDQGGAATHPMTPEHLPYFFAAPGETDQMMVMTGLFLLGGTLALGAMFLWLHTLPERMAHGAKRFQFEVVAVLGLLALFTHTHAFWVAGLLLALVDLPDISTPMKRMVGALERIAGGREEGPGDSPPGPEPVQNRAASAGAGPAPRRADAPAAPMREG